MSILSQTQAASFKNAVFLLRDDRTEGGRKTVTHEFPNRDTREVEDLGQMQKSFSITGIIHDGNGTYFTDRDALLEALESPGSGILVHPFFGSIQVSLINYVLTQSFTDLNRAVFAMTFEVRQEPVGFTLSDAPGTKAAASVNSGTAIQKILIDNITNNFKIGKFFSLNFTDAESVITELLNVFADNLNVLNTAPDQLNDFNLTLNDFRDNLRSSINTPSILSGRFDDLFEQNAIIGKTSGNQIRISDRLFNFKSQFADVPTTTVQRLQRQNNRDIIQTAVKTNALKDEFIESQNIEFVTDIQVDERQAVLEGKFQELSETFETKPLALPDDLFAELQVLRNLTREFFDEQRVQAFRITSFATPDVPATVLSHRLYGSTENTQALVDLNESNNPTFLGGDLKVLGA